MTIRISTPRAARAAEMARLRTMASQIQSEAHWDAIKASMPAKNAEELEAVLGPMLRHRQAVVCRTPDCDSGQPPIWTPVLSVRSLLAPDGQDEWIVRVEVQYCEECHAAITVDHILTDDIWRQIVNDWPHQDRHSPPSRNKTALGWERPQ